MCGTVENELSVQALALYVEYDLVGVGLLRFDKKRKDDSRLPESRNVAKLTQAKGPKLVRSALVPLLRLCWRLGV